MHLFEFILILLMALLLSNVINRFLPYISVPIIQISLGVIVALLPIGLHLELEPELFFILFIAPLIYHASFTADKKSLWSLKRPIFRMAIYLVFVTVIGVGYFVNFLIPSLSLFASFILIAALGPTDIVAVSSVGERIKMPPKIMGILSGEASINDASGIVCFQFAVATMLTGSFSFVDATVSFLILGLGGVFIGLLLTFIKLLAVRQLRSLGMESVTFYILIGVLTPFVVYLIAEWCHVSGILAVFAAGIAQTLGGRHLNPENINLNYTSKSIWEVITFTLDGLVFLILGTQLPAIIKTARTDSIPMNMGVILFYVILITFVLVLFRFVWAYLTIGKKDYCDDENDITKFKGSLIISLSGARGAVTMASALSIPLLLKDGTPFLQRDFIILVSSGVILCSLLITNFILPLIVSSGDEIDNPENKNTAYIEILQNVIRELNKQTTDENKQATEIVKTIYYQRTSDLMRKHNTLSLAKHEQKELLLEALEWEKENTYAMLRECEINDGVAEIYLQALDKKIKRTKADKKLAPQPMKFARNGLMNILHVNARGYSDEQRQIHFEQNNKLIESNFKFVLGKLKEMNVSGEDSAVNKLISDYMFMITVQKGRTGGMRIEQKENDVSVYDVTFIAFQLERDNIQHMYESGHISQETAKEMRKNISFSEMQIKESLALKD